MSSIPSNLARVPNALISQIIVGSLNRTSSEILRTQIQLSSGLALNRPSDDSVAASTISVLDDVIERRTQRLRNLSHSDAMLNNIDAALADANDELIEAKGIALSQIGLGSDAQTRSNQAKVINAMLENLMSISNRQYQDIYFFGGNRTTKPPITELLGGLQYNGEGKGLTADFGLSKPVAITMSASQAFGSLSTRIQGSKDLNPGMIPSTRLLDLNGARGFGVNPGTVEINVGGTLVSADLTNAHTVQDAIDSLQTAMQTIDAGATLVIASTGDTFQVIGNSTTIRFSDPAGGTTVADLGLTPSFVVGSGVFGADVDPRLTELTKLADLTGVSVPLGTVRLSSAGQIRDVDLSGAQNIQDIQNAFRASGLGVRVEIAETGDRINVINEVSGASLSIGPVGGSSTADQLGIRSFTDTTLLTDFNDGRGVDIVSGRVDPISGMPDPTRDLDFNITLRDGSTFDVDLSGATTVADVITSINGAASAAGFGGTGPGSTFFVRLTGTGNGLELLDNTGGGGMFSVTGLNGSHAAEHLGILGSTSSANMIGEDRATVAVESVFSHLIALRDALEANDENGIEIATGKIEEDILRVTEARADIGIRSRRVADTTLRVEDLRIQDMALKSQVQDLDYTEAAIRFSSLQQQLQAGLASASQISTLTLLDFLR
ncbi:MAG: flagellin [Planctomycetota bacterium]|nr:flagellin [Planctomycetota bacterium]